VYRKLKEQAYEVRKTNKPAATWKVFAMVRLLTLAITGSQEQRDEGALLLAVRVDGVVSFHQ
jgi:hypothetical protein